MGKITKYRDIQLSNDRFARVFHRHGEKMSYIDLVERRENGHLYLIKTVYVDDNATDERIVFLCGDV